MGLFGKIKDAQKQAQDAMANMPSGAGSMSAGGMSAGMPGMGGQDMTAMAAMAAKMQKISAAGVEAPGVVKSITATGTPDMSGGTMHAVGVTIAPDGGAPYDAVVEQSLLPAQLETLSVGAMVTVKFDPDMPTSAVLWSW